MSLNIALKICLEILPQKYVFKILSRKRFPCRICIPNWKVAREKISLPIRNNYRYPALQLKLTSLLYPIFQYHTLQLFEITGYTYLPASTRVGSNEKRLGHCNGPAQPSHLCKWEFVRYECVLALDRDSNSGAKLNYAIFQ